MSLNGANLELKTSRSDDSPAGRDLDTQPAAAPRPRTVRIGLLGYGRVGQAVAATATRERDRLAGAGVRLTCHHALVRDVRKPRSGPPLGLYDDGGAIVNARVDVIVEALGDAEPARTLLTRALERGIPVVTANKTLVAHHGRALEALARRRQTIFAFDAAVVAGVPFLGSLARRPLVSATERIAGVINGTSHFILTAMDGGASYQAALAEAVERGYAEPDSRADTSGRDAAEKLTILLHLAGCRDVEVADLTCAPLDAVDAADLACAREGGGAIKPVALASLTASRPGAWVGPVFVRRDHPFAHLSGVDNALAITAENGHTVTFAGPGAGPDVTAVTIIDDIVEAVTAHAPAPEFVRPSPRGVAAPLLREPPASEWWLRVAGADGRRVSIEPTQSWASIRNIVESHRTQGRSAVALPVLAREPR